MDIFTKCSKYSLANDLRAKGVYPYFHALETRQDTEVIMEGKRRIMLGSNNYLGLTTCPEVLEAGLEALKQYGTGCSGSRFLNGTLKLHIELETELADFLHKEACCTFSTGFQSNLGIIAALVGHGDYVICDKENHASIYDGCRLSYGRMLTYAHSNMEELEIQLQKVPESAGCLIVTDGVFSMGGDIAKLPEIVALARKYGARVMVDDAHGLGVIGEGGRGTASYFGLEDEVDVIMGTFSKSLASLGGYAVASETVIDYIRHNSRPFIFSASIPPANAATALAALRHIRNHPEIVKRLSDLSAYMRRGLKARGVPIIESTTPIIPIYTYTMENTLYKARRLYDAGVYVNPVLPPATAPDKCLLRTSYMATLSEALLDEAIEIFARELAEGGSMSRVAVVTGGTSGIGLATANALKDAGVKVYVLSRHAAELPGLFHIAADVSNEESVAAAIHEVHRREGRLDILVNNAGFGISGAAEFTENADAKRLLDVNLFGMVNATKASLPLMRAQGGGRIVNVSSVAAPLSIPFQAWYSVSKAAVNAYTLALFNEVKQMGVSVCAVMPGDIHTGFTAARKKCPAGDDVYAGRIARSVAKMEKDEENGMAPEVAGRFLAHVALKKRVKPYYAIGLTYKFFVLLSRILPIRMIGWLLGLLYAGN